MATLGEQAVGSIVKLNVNGTAREFIVVQQGLPGTMYDASCDGTWLLMQDCYEKRTWNTRTNDYANSTIHSYLNSTFLGLFDSDIQGVIKQVKIPYTKSTGSGGTLATGSSGISAKVFLLSAVEVGTPGFTYYNAEGRILSYFSGAANSKRIAKLSGSAIAWWTRSPLTNNTTSVWRVDTSGAVSGGETASISRGIRPALVIPSEIAVNSDGTIAVSSGAITGQVNIGGVMRELTGEGYLNIGGVLRNLSDSQVNIGGVLKSLKG